MLGRLGDVLYWLGCIAATLIAALGSVISFSEGRAHGAEGIWFGVASFGLLAGPAAIFFLENSFRCIYKLVECKMHSFNPCNG